MVKSMIDLSKIPNNPGCYIYKDKENSIIYVGKAKNLKKRVSSYFLNKDQTPKTQSLISNISNIDFIVTNNELEALILENTLIKKHLPKYNIDLKNSERYAYIKISPEKFPRLLTQREKPDLKDENVFGPFVSGQNRSNLIKYLNKTFKLRTCKRLPKTPCIRYHIGYCSAPCIKKITEKEYQEIIEHIKKILSGKSAELIEELNKKMKEYTNKKNFERSLILRDQITAIKYLTEKQNVETKKTYDQDVVDFIIKENIAYVLLFNIDKGTLVNKIDKKIDINLIDISIMDDFLINYYSNNVIPKEIILSKKIDSNTIKYLEHIKISNLKITIPKKGEKKELLDLCKKNIELNFFKNELILEDLKKKLNLKYLPKVIECFDISHFSGKDTVGSMVYFKNGLPDKKNYRKFKIRSLPKDKIDDFSSIKEVVKRRYSRLVKEKKDLPNLIVIDGGKGQLSCAKEILKELDVLDKIDLISLAKRDEEIFKVDNLFPIKLSKKDQSLQLLQRIRDEAHRFAITYNRQIRNRKKL
jgi:excinuclease ABC subunit C